MQGAERRYPQGLSNSEPFIIIKVMEHSKWTCELIKMNDRNEPNRTHSFTRQRISKFEYFRFLKISSDVFFDPDTESPSGVTTSPADPASGGGGGTLEGGKIGLE